MKSYLSKIIFIFILLSPIRALAYPSGIVASYTFDKNDVNWTTRTVADASGNGNTMSIVGFPTTTTPVPGKVQQSFKGDYIGSHYLSVPTLDNTNFPQTSGTVEFWIKNTIPGDTPFTDTDPVFDYFDASRKHIMMRYTNTGGNGIQIAGQNTSTWAFVYIMAIPRNSWTHVALTWDTSTLQANIYKNGTLVNTSSISDPTFVPSAQDFKLLGATGFRSASTMDEFRVYNRALAASEIYNEYISGISKFGINTSTKSSSTLNANLIAYYTLDGKDINWGTGTTSDLSINKFEGSLKNLSTTTSPSSGKTGQGIFFNGVNNYITIPDQDVFSPSVNDMTISLWARIPKNAPAIGNGGGGNSGSYFIGKGTSGQWEWTLENDLNSRVYFSVYKLDGSTGATATYVRSMNDDLWHNYTITVSTSSDTIRMYVDGVSVTLANALPTMSNGTSPLDIGRRPDGQYFYGYEDEIKIYNRILSSAEIKDLYRSVINKYSIAPKTYNQPSELSSGLIGYYTFDNIDVNWTTRTMTDASGSGNTASILGMPTTTSPTAGISNQAFSWNNNSANYISVPTLNDTNFPQITGSISVWFKNDYRNMPTTGDNIFNNWSSSYNHIFVRTTNPNSIQVQGQVVGGTSAFANSYTISIGAWHHIVAEWDTVNDVYSVYIDGVAKTINGSITDTSWLPSTQPFTIGGGAGGNDSYAGKIDEFRLYNRLLTQAEVTKLYKLGKSISR
jgi:hypothetical protein